ncbi:polyamine-modulated factor 1 [Mustelus asterias]
MEREAGEAVGWAESESQRRAAEPGAQRGAGQPGAESESQRRAAEPGAQRGAGQPGAESEAQRRAAEPGAECEAQRGADQPGAESEAQRRAAEPGAQRGAGQPGAESEAQRGAAQPKDAAAAQDGAVQLEAQASPGVSDSSPSSGAEAAVRAEESKRLKLFSVAMETTLEKLLETASFERFSKCFEAVYELHPQFTQSVYKQLISQLQNSIQEEVRQISEDGLFERALPKLDQLEEDSEERSEPAWRPSGSPATDVQRHLVPYRQQQRDYLRLKLKRAKEENAALAQSVLSGRERIEALARCRDEQCQRWQECTELCRQFQLDEQ